ncbi:MAG TPA: ribonuclease P protein component [Candidatus Paceibacterota bacterium]
MLPKKNRAGTKAVEKIFKEGRVFSSPNLTFKWVLISAGKKEISFIVPKSVARLAVKRNSLRRLGYNILKKYINDFPDGVSGVLVFKKYQDNALLLENEIKSILAKFN